VESAHKYIHFIADYTDTPVFNASTYQMRSRMGFFGAKHPATARPA